MHSICICTPDVTWCICEDPPLTLSLCIIQVGGDPCHCHSHLLPFFFPERKEKSRILFIPKRKKKLRILFIPRERKIRKIFFQERKILFRQTRLRFRPCYHYGGFQIKKTEKVSLLAQPACILRLGSVQTFTVFLPSLEAIFWGCPVTL